MTMNPVGSKIGTTFRCRRTTTGGSAESWDSGPVDSAAASVVYDGLPLQDGQRYYVRGRVHNGVLRSSWCYFQIRMNSVPTAGGLFPDDMLEITENPPVLHHPTVVDDELDEVIYSYQLYADEQLTTLIEESLNLTIVGDSAAWPTTILLDTDADYFWRVRCGDPFEYGQWSESASFLLVPAYICGDANGDESVDVGDAVYIINYVFKGGVAPEPIEAGDANSDKAVDVGDAVYMINYVFKGGPAPCS